MDKSEKIFAIVLILIVLLVIAGALIELDARENCQEYYEACYRTEAVFLGERDIETRCSNDNWDIRKKRCIDPGYFWEDLQ